MLPSHKHQKEKPMSADPKTPAEGENVAIDALSEIVMVLNARMTLITHTIDKHSETIAALMNRQKEKSQ
jgi:hypothetical protein